MIADKASTNERPHDKLWECQVFDLAPCITAQCQTAGFPPSLGMAGASYLVFRVTRSGEFPLLRRHLAGMTDSRIVYPTVLLYNLTTPHQHCNPARKG